MNVLVGRVVFFYGKDPNDKTRTVPKYGRILSVNSLAGPANIIVQSFDNGELDSYTIAGKIYIGCENNGHLTNSENPLIEAYIDSNDRYHRLGGPAFISHKHYGGNKYFYRGVQCRSAEAVFDAAKEAGEEMDAIYELGVK